jgi:hypothetical protein
VHDNLQIIRGWWTVPWDRYIRDVRAVVPNAATEVIGFE